VWTPHALTLRGITVSSAGVRGVWGRDDPLSKHDRLLRLEQTPRETTFELPAEQIHLLERFSPEFRERQIEVDYTGELVAVDAFLVGSLKGVDKVYLQTVLDCYSGFAWRRLYTSKLPVTAAPVVNGHVLPFFEAHQAAVDTILSDDGREFCGRPDQHPYEPFMQLEGRPQSNGFIERPHQGRIMGRRTPYVMLGEGLSKRHEICKSDAA